MCFVLGFSPSWKVPVRSGGAEPTAHSCGPPHERSQLLRDYRAPGAWGGGRSTRAVALSSLPCLTPPFISASLATLSFPPLPLLSLHLASFPCLPPSPSHCTWLCWLPLHCSCHSLLLDPVLSSPNPQLPAHTLLHQCPGSHVPDVPLHHLPPQPKTSLSNRGRRGVVQNLPQVFSICVQKAFPPFPTCPDVPTRLLPGSHPSLCCHSQASLCLLHQPHGSNDLAMLVDHIHTVVRHSL